MGDALTCCCLCSTCFLVVCFTIWMYEISATHVGSVASWLDLQQSQEAWIEYMGGSGLSISLLYAQLYQCCVGKKTAPKWLPRVSLIKHVLYAAHGTEVQRQSGGNPVLCSPGLVILLVTESMQDTGCLHSVLVEEAICKRRGKGDWKLVSEMSIQTI